MSVQVENRYYTREEYLALEEAAEYKNEYYDGEIIPMTGGTTNHNRISLNFCRKFPLTANGEDYEAFMGDVRLWIPQYRCYVYPDVMVIRGEPVYEGKGTTTITNPILIIEVKSNSTENYDRRDKFRYYRAIPNFQEYLLVDQYSFQIEQFFKQSNGQWLFSEYEGESAILPLKSIPLEIPFKDIYQRVSFDQA
ncbi:MAG: Uma2 family endonuclease [Desertifilum sp. SIO1I2]|nr:Uma2 family endonuclease [Desertifilum sp. SIO1I2]